MKHLHDKNGTARPSSLEQRLLRQEFGHLSTRIIHDLPATGTKMRRIGFCAGNPKEGCTSVATNYAMFCGQQGIRTTLLESSLRRPSLARYLGVTEVPGLREFLEGTATAAEVLRQGVADGVNLVPGGSAAGDVVLTGESFDLSRLFDFLAPHNDVVVVDVPPLTSSPEANLILPQLDGVVLVIEANRNRLCAVERTLRSIQQLGVNVIGSVLNKMRYDLPTIVDRLL